MYACPHWDEHLANAVKAVGHNYFFISATAIERQPQSACSIQGDYGVNPQNFEETKLLQEYAQLPMQDWMGATWPPNVVHKDIWNLVGGYSIEFTPGMYSDPDFSMKLWQVGVRYFRGVAASRVYHFGSVTVKRIVKNPGYYKFILKWRMTARSFSDQFLLRGKPFTGYANEVEFPFTVRVKNMFKSLVALFK